MTQSSAPSSIGFPFYGFPGLFLLGALFLLVGLTGHDPWRGDDSLYFGPVFAMLQGEGLLIPQIAGQHFLDFPPLYYWLSCATAFITSPFLAVHDGARLAAALTSAITLFALHRAARDFYGTEHGIAAGLLTIGSLGLVVHAHEAQPMLAVMMAMAITLAGIARLNGGKRGGIYTVSTLTLSLATFPCNCQATSLPKQRRSLIIAQALGLALAALWPIAVLNSDPQVFHDWLALNLEALRPDLSFSDLRRLTEIFSWFTWPLWPLAAWTCWRHRQQLNEARWLVPLCGVAVAILLILGGPLRPARFLPLLPPLALLSAGGLFTLRRGAANAFDWFAAMTFGFFAILVWLAWSAMAWSWPPGLTRQAAKLAPTFRLDDVLMPVTVGIAVCTLWISLLLQSPRAPRRGAFNWAMGMTMLWCLAVALLLPWFQHGKTYRPAAEALADVLAHFQQECVATQDVNMSQRAAFDYFANLRFPPVQSGQETCKMLLVYGNAAPSLDPQHWEEVWQFRRGGGRQLETFRLYRRD